MQHKPNDNPEMNTDITIHTSPLGDTIRAIVIDDTPYFVGKDVALALGYSDPTNALKQHCDDGVVKRHPILDNLGRIQQVRIISEADVYSLIFGSKLPEAISFKRWVTEEVLPSIRKHGGYLLSSPDETPEQLMARALKVADATMKKYKENNRMLAARNQFLSDKVEQDAPKVLYADAVADSKSLCLIRDLAKVVTQTGVKIGGKHLFDWLKEKKLLCSDNSPQQWAVERGFFRVVKHVITKPNGDSLVSSTTKVTGKGQQYILDRILKEQKQLPTAI